MELMSNKLSMYVFFNKSMDLLLYYHSYQMNITTILMFISDSFIMDM
jgi:hypothetical protein